MIDDIIRQIHSISRMNLIAIVITEQIHTTITIEAIKGWGLSETSPTLTEILGHPIIVGDSKMVLRLLKYNPKREILFIREVE